MSQFLANTHRTKPLGMLLVGLSLGVVMCALPACSSNGLTPSPPSSSGGHTSPVAFALQGSQWRVVSVSAAKNLALPANAPTLQFGTNGQVSGHGGCNRFFGQYSHNPMAKSVSFGQLGSTKMYCVTGNASDFEGIFFKALEQSAQYQWDGQVLELQNGNGQTLVVLARAS